MKQVLGGNSGSRKPDPSFTGSGPSGFDSGRIRVNWKHIDGPLMTLPDGQLKWLSWRERFMHWIGRWSLEDIARRPDGFTKLVYYPPADTWLDLPADYEGPR
jgi:hypothetical protein